MSMTKNTGDPRIALTELATQYGWVVQSHSPDGSRSYGEIVDYKQKHGPSAVIITWSPDNEVLHVANSWGRLNDPGYEGSVGLSIAREWIMQLGISARVGE